MKTIDTKKKEIVEEKTIGKIVTGVVVSTKTPQTVQVKVERLFVHPIYKKPVRRSNKLAAHNTLTDIQVGDTVKLISSKPISKTKHYKVIEKVTI